MEYKVVVIGGGESGIGAALLATKMNYEVFLTDSGEISEQMKTELHKNNIPFEEKGHDFERLSFANLVVKSPGVPQNASVVKFFADSMVDIISEIEFGYLHYSGLVLAVTGSNGKTTTSGLLYHIMQNAKYDVQIGGNYGISFSRILSKENPAYMVLEVSSFQLDQCFTFKPHVATILNITPDHLDRYDYSFDAYVASKYRIAQVQNSEDWLIINGDDEGSNSGKHWINDQVNVLSLESMDWENGISSKEEVQFEIPLSGKHNLFNSAIAVEMCRKIGLTDAQIAEGVKSFTNLPHRFQTVAMINEIRFINDSKATNVDSTYYALDAVKDGKVIWIVGGVDKGNNYSSLLPLVEENVKGIICLGKDNTKIIDFFSNKVDLIEESMDVNKVVEKAWDWANEGDTILLSPACASFDLFNNYIDRGNSFVEAVEQLKNKIRQK